MLRPRSPLSLALLLSLSLPAASRAEWQPGFAPADFEVYALCTFEGQLVAGGAFTGVMSPGLSYVARWNGSTWQPMGSALNGAVRTLTVFAGELVAGGQFTTADGKNVRGIARWDGDSWEPFGGGLIESWGGTYALAVRDGELLAAGVFPDEEVKRWTGVQWQGLLFNIHALTELAVHEGDLIVGGQLNSGVDPAELVMRWDGQTWTDISEGLDGNIGAIVSWNGQLVVGGAFTHASGAPVNRLVVWNGTGWSELGSGVDGTVQCLGIAPDGKLVVGGDFGNAGGIPAAHVATWDGTSWAPLGGGTDAPVYALADYNGVLAVGGRFAEAGTEPATAVATWGGSTWTGIMGLGGGAGLNGVTAALAFFQGELIAAGSFSRAGTTAANRIARWDGSAWHALGSGVNDEVFGVAALLVHEGLLVAGGWFTEAGGVPANHIARWDGMSWSPLGDGFNGPVHALAEFEGDLIAGGNFTYSGSTLTAKVARWDGTAWAPVGWGFDKPVYGLTVQGSTLVAVGLISYTYGSNLNQSVARWTGSLWENVGSGLGPGAVHTVCTYGGELIVGGVQPIGVKRWDGSTWTPLGGGVSRWPVGNYVVKALTAYQGKLVVAGSFNRAGGESVNNIGLWDGISWEELGTGTWSSGGTYPGRIDAVAAANGSLFVGGDFVIAGPYPSQRIGLWYAPQTSDTPGVASRHRALAAVPNPFNPRTAIRFEVTRHGNVDLRVYDVAGRQVRTLVRGLLAPDQHGVLWDGTDDRGRPLPSGVYLCRLQTADGTGSMKLTLLR